MLQPIWAMIKPFGFAVLWIWHPSEVSALSGWFDAAFSLINSGCVFRGDPATRTDGIRPPIPI